MGEMKPYVVVYVHNRTGQKTTATLWARSIRDARQRFAECDDRQQALRIVSVARAEA